VLSLLQNSGAVSLPSRSVPIVPINVAVLGCVECRGGAEVVITLLLFCLE
jgi:hypothetical protein